MEHVLGDFTTRDAHGWHVFGAERLVWPCVPAAAAALDHTFLCPSHDSPAAVDSALVHVVSGSSRTSAAPLCSSPPHATTTGHGGGGGQVGVVTRPNAA